MKLQFKLAISILALFILFTSCEDETLVLEEQAFGYEYYPIAIGNYWVYKVDSTVVANISGQKQLLETTSYVREDIISSFLNPEGDTSYVLQRSVSDAPNGSFRSTDIWKIEKTEKNLSRFEENLQFIKLVFPVDIGDMWDGNLFDHRLKIPVAQQEMEPYLEWSYSVDSIKVAESINGVAYSDVIKVTQAQYVNDIEQRLSFEKYSPNIGMIYREMSILDSQCFEPECEDMDWIDKANRGYQLRQTLIEHN